MEIILKQFKGYSGSKVFLIKDDKKIFIRKTKNIDRNYERLSFLRNLGYNVPAIYNKNKDILDMQYIDASVIFCDIDGTIIKAQGKNEYSKRPIGLNSNILLLQERIKHGD